MLLLISLMFGWIHFRMNARVQPSAIRLPIRIENALKKTVYRKRPRDMVFGALVEGIRHTAELFPRSGCR